MLRRDVSFLCSDLSIEPLCAAPDAVELRLLQRRLAASGHFRKMLMCLIGIAEAFQDASGIMGQRGVAAAFGNDDVAIAAGVHGGVKIVVSKEGGQRHRAVEDIDLRLLCTEEEPSSIECLGVEIREDGIYQLFHLAVLAGFGNSINGEEDVELRPCSFATFGFHVIAAVMNRKGNTGESCSDV